MLHGIEFGSSEAADRVAQEAYSRRLILETCGPTNAVVKLMPPLTISDEDLDDGLARLGEAIQAARARR
jgi:diaminobutyrate-2-oxoglutarate transaminase